MSPNPYATDACMNHHTALNQRDAYPFLVDIPSMGSDLGNDSTTSSRRRKWSRKTSLGVADAAHARGLQPDEAYREVFNSMMSGKFEHCDNILGREILVKESKSSAFDLTEPPSHMNRSESSRIESVLVSSFTPAKSNKYSEDDELSLANTSVSSITTKGSASTNMMPDLLKEPGNAIQKHDQEGIFMSWVHEVFFDFFCEACLDNTAKKVVQ